jgi:glycosyltransferase involved in cell wall biosynthesis
MRPFALITGDFVKTGGMDRANYALAMLLAQREHAVHLVAHRVAPELAALPNVTVHHVPKVANSYFLAGPLLDHAGRRWGKRISRLGGRVVVNGGNCRFGDVNWVHYLHAVYTPHVSGRWTARLRRRFAYRLDRRKEKHILTCARVVIANSQATRRHLIERCHLDPDRVHTIYYGVDPTQFYPATAEERRATRSRLGWPQTRLLVAFVGALGDRRKGFDTLFAAWQYLCRDSQWDAELVVVGSGAELPAWQTRVAAAGLSERIRFLGFRSDVPELLRACDALVSPTRYEAYGLNVHEALCCGLPAFVSASAGVAERYPPELRDLLLPDPNDAADLAARLRTWQENSERYRPILACLAADLRRYTWEDMGRLILDCIDRAT